MCATQVIKTQEPQGYDHETTFICLMTKVSQHDQVTQPSTAVVQVLYGHCQLRKRWLDCNECQVTSEMTFSSWQHFQHQCLYVFTHLLCQLLTKVLKLFLKELLRGKKPLEKSNTQYLQQADCVAALLSSCWKEELKRLSCYHSLPSKWFNPDGYCWLSVHPDILTLCETLEYFYLYLVAHFHTV